MEGPSDTWSCWGLQSPYHTLPTSQFAPAGRPPNGAATRTCQIGAGRYPRPLARLLRMQIKPFRIEQYFGKYEFTARYLLSSSDAESRTIKELLDLEPGAHERLLEHWCGYTESPGAPWLREAIAAIYQQVKSGDVLVLAAAEEGIFVLYHALVGPGDHVIVETPCYESGLEVARSTGAQVSEWRRTFENGWAHEFAALEKLIQPNTKVIYINTPHNPTGLLMPAPVFRQVLALAASRNPEIIRRCLEFKYYTTICSSAPSEFLTALALRHREVLVQRNLQIVLRNLRLLDAFMQQRPHWFEWVKPNAGPIGFAHFKPERDVLAFCEEVVRDSGVLLLPGTVYDQPRHIRFGFGRKNMPESLAQFDA